MRKNNETPVVSKKDETTTTVKRNEESMNDSMLNRSSHDDDTIGSRSTSSSRKIPRSISSSMKKTTRQAALEEWRRSKKDNNNNNNKLNGNRQRTSSIGSNTNMKSSDSKPSSQRSPRQPVVSPTASSNNGPTSRSTPTPLEPKNSTHNNNNNNDDNDKIAPMTPQCRTPLTKTAIITPIHNSTPFPTSPEPPKTQVQLVYAYFLSIFDYLLRFLFPRQYQQEEENKAILRQLSQATEQLDLAVAERDDYMSAFEEYKAKLFEMNGEIAILAETLKTCKRAEAQAVEQVRVLQEQLHDYHTIKNELTAVRQQFQTMKDAWVPRTQMQQEVETIQTKLDELNFQLRISKQQNEHDNVQDEEKKDREDVNDPVVAKALLQEKEQTILSLKMQMAQAEISRRRMHNQIQELRGNIRTYVRVRPFVTVLDGEDEQTMAIKVVKDGDALVLNREINGKSSEHPFQFNRVFGPWNSQGDVFDEVSDFVQSAMDGYNVCLFSYGQTGSGKTHTMQGSGVQDQRGIISRAVEQILTLATSNTLVPSSQIDDSEWSYTLQASFLEIYNESLRDLLVVEDDNLAELAKSDNLELGYIAPNNTIQTMASPPKTAKKLAMRKDPNDGRMYVEGLTTVCIDTTSKEKGMSQLFAVMDVASRSRSVAATKMNLESSRSHSIFILRVVAYNQIEETTVNGSLNLVDLAGSERLSRSESNGDAKLLKEAQAINSSLSCLGDVFVALANDASHIPYRNSKLTYLLQDCLGGDGKTCMFVNLSPSSASCNESLCSLRFAQRVSKVELGKATKCVQLTKSK